MNVLVTGAAGFLGRALVGRLSARNADDVRCLVRASTSRDSLDAELRAHPERRARVMVGSLGAIDEARRAIEGADVVYHLAARLDGTPDEIARDTVDATRNLVAALRQEAPRALLVLVSSFSVYGVAALHSGAVLDERSPLEPMPERRDPYSQAKLEQERACRAAAAEGQPLVVMRPGVIYGPGRLPLPGRAGFRSGGFFISVSGDNPLPLTWVANCADAIALAGEQAGQAVGQAYNVVDDGIPTCREFLAWYRTAVEPLRIVPVSYGAMLAYAYVQRALRGPRAPARLDPYRVATTWRRLRFPNARLKELGWTPRVSIAEGLAACAGAAALVP